MLRGDIFLCWSVVMTENEIRFTKGSKSGMESDQLLKEILLYAGTNVTEINIKKSNKKKSNRNVKRCRDGTPKRMQTR